MNFEVHNISRKNQVVLRNSESTMSLYASRQKGQLQAEEETKKLTQAKVDPYRQYRLRRRSYELPLL
jgi:hypothetical protein